MSASTETTPRENSLNEFDPEQTAEILRIARSRYEQARDGEPTVVPPVNDDPNGYYEIARRALWGFNILGAASLIFILGLIVGRVTA